MNCATQGNGVKNWAGAKPLPLIRCLKLNPEKLLGLVDICRDSAFELVQEFLREAAVEFDVVGR
jgi:hypothetical protein